MKILVTGGAGFIGSSFVRYIADNFGWEIVVYDKLTYAGRIENLAEIIDKISFIRGDIADEQMFRSVINRFKPDIIINFAAETHVDRSINDPAPFIKTNIFGVFIILEAIKNSKNKDTLFIHISTDEVYGDLWNLDIEASENHPMNPSNPYSASKASGDLLIMAYGRTYKIRYRIIRPCNNYGPRQHPEKLIPRTIIRLLHNKPATIYGNGSQIRDWLFVEDTVKAIVTVIDRGIDGEIYNICANEYRSVKEVVEYVVRLMNKDVYRDILYVRSRPGEDRRYAMKCDKIRDLGWRHSIGFEEGLRKTIEWYITNNWWWKSTIDEKYLLNDIPW